MPHRVGFVIGSLTSDYLRIAITPDRDPDWLAATVDVHVGGFEAHVKEQLSLHDLATFRDELQRLHDELTGEAKLEPIEGWLIVHLIGDGRGHLEVRCELVDSFARENRLGCRLQLDQTHLPALLFDLDAALATIQAVAPPATAPA